MKFLSLLLLLSLTVACSGGGGGSGSSSEDKDETETTGGSGSGGPVPGEIMGLAAPTDEGLYYSYATALINPGDAVFGDYYGSTRNAMYTDRGVFTNSDIRNFIPDVSMATTFDMGGSFDQDYRGHIDGDTLHIVNLNNVTKVEMTLDSSYSDAVVNSIFMLDDKLTALYCDRDTDLCYIKIEGENDIAIGADISTKNVVVDANRAVFATKDGEVKSLSSAGVLTTSGNAWLSGKITGTPDYVIGFVYADGTYSGLPDLEGLTTTASSLSSTEIATTISNLSLNTNDGILMYYTLGGGYTIVDHAGVSIFSEYDISIYLLGITQDEIFYILQAEDNGGNPNNQFMVLNRNTRVWKLAQAPNNFRRFYGGKLTVLKNSDGYYIPSENMMNNRVDITMLDLNFENPVQLPVLPSFDASPNMLAISGEKTFIVTTNDFKINLVQVNGATSTAVADFFPMNLNQEPWELVPSSENGTVSVLITSPGGEIEMTQIKVKE